MIGRREFLRASGGLIAAPYLAAALPAQAQEQVSLTVGMQASVTTDGVNVRGGPGANQPVLGSLNAGTSVDVLGSSTDGAWWRVASDSFIGYVNGAFLEGTTKANTPDVVDVDLAIPYARQLNAIWCDPADLEMWMSYNQARVTNGGTAALQSAIWDWETSHNAGFSVDQWDCSPFAVASAASHWMSDASFDHFTYDDPIGGSRVLAWLVANRQVRQPSVALIWKGLHYVLVRGVRSIGDPGQDPTGAQLLGFYVADPDPAASFWLGADRFIAIDRWLNELFTPVTYLTPHTGVPGDQWQDRMVTIQQAWSTGGPTQSGQRNASVADYLG